MADARERGCELLLPIDVVVADRFAADAETRVVPVSEIPDGWMGLDIGPATTELYASRLGAAETIFWNGPMGVFELEPFAQGTLAVAHAVADSSAVSVVGGGDSVAAVNVAGVADQHHARLDRRRRRAGAGRGQAAARRGRAGGIAGMSGRRPFVAGNWKMHKTASETGPFVADAGGAAAGRGRGGRVRAVHVAGRGGARPRPDRRCASTPRTCTRRPQGAFTGEISAAMLLDLGVTACCSATPSGGSTSTRPTPRWPRSWPRPTPPAWT